jgi:hypothetical protein
MIDLSPNRADYFTQLNNEQDPTIACQSTTAAQCINIVDDVTLLKGPYKQPEDNLRRFCKYDLDCIAFAKNSHGPTMGVSTQVSHISEWADVLIFAINKLMGYPCARFHGNITPELLFADLKAGLPIQVSMKFSGIAGHYLSVVGQTDDGDWIINDPYRNWLKNTPDGFHCIYTPTDWAAHSKGYGLRFSRRV